MCALAGWQSSHLSSDLSFFASLAPSLQWHLGAACYTHSIEFSADQPASRLAAALRSDDDQAASAAATPVARTALSFERILELSLLADSSDSNSDDEEDGGDRTHPRPFFGALNTTCRMSGCVVTKAVGGGFYHRCPARLDPLAAHSAASSSSSSSSSAQATVSCRGVLVWSLPDSLFLRVAGREFGATPFGGRIGLWKERTSIEEEKRQRMDRIRAAQSRHEGQAQQAPMDLTTILTTIKPSAASKQEAVISMSD